MRNGSIVLGESTLNLVLPRLTKESPIIFYILFFLISYSRRRAKACIFNIHFWKKINEKSTKHTTHTLPSPSPFVICDIAFVVGHHRRLRHCPCRSRYHPRRCKTYWSNERFCVYMNYFPPAILLIDFQAIFARRVRKDGDRNAF